MNAQIKQLKLLPILMVQIFLSLVLKVKIFNAIKYQQHLIQITLLLFNVLIPNYHLPLILHVFLVTDLIKFHSMEFAHVQIIMLLQFKYHLLVIINAQSIHYLEHLTYVFAIQDILHHHIQIIK